MERAELQITMGTPAPDKVHNFISKIRAPDKMRIFISTLLFPSPNPMFDHLLEASQRDDSKKWLNIGFGEEITQVMSIEVQFTQLIWSSVKCLKKNTKSYV